MLPLKFLHLQSGCSLTSTYTPIARPVRGSNSARRACTRGTPRRRTPQRSASVSAGRETGLDFVRGADRAAQLSALRTQLRLARERGLPVVLHCVRAFEPLMRELAASEPRAVIFHGFIGSPEQARQALAKGYCLSFGERTFASPKTLAALRETPLSQLFLETDDSPVPIAEIYARAAEAKGVPEEELQRAILDNYKRIFTGGEYEGPGRTKGDK